MQSVSRHFKTSLALFALSVLSMLPLIAKAAPPGTMLAPAGLKQGDWRIRFKATNILPVHQSSQTSPSEGQLETLSRLLPTLDVSHFMNTHWSVEVMAGVITNDYSLEDSLLDDLNISRIKNATVSPVMQYHLRSDATLNPYPGTGIHHTWPINVESAPGMPDIQMEALVSPLLDAGLDYRLSEHWYASASMRYVITLAQHFSGEGFSAKSNTDALTLGAGMGLRF